MSRLFITFFMTLILATWSLVETAPLAASSSRATSRNAIIKKSDDDLAAVAEEDLDNDTAPGAAGWRQDSATNGAAGVIRKNSDLVKDGGYAEEEEYDDAAMYEIDLNAPIINIRFKRADADVSTVVDVDNSMGKMEEDAEASEAAVAASRLIDNKTNTLRRSRSGKKSNRSLRKSNRRRNRRKRLRNRLAKNLS